MRTIDRRWQLAGAWCLATVLLTGCATLPPPVVTPTAPTRGTLAFVTTDDLTDQPLVCSVSLHTGESGQTAAATGYLAFDHIEIGPRGVEIKCEGYLERFYSADAFTVDVPLLQVPVSMVKTPPPPRVISPPWIGQLHKARDDLGFQDASGAWVLPVCAHYGEASSAFAHDKVVAGVTVPQQLQRIKAAGYDCIRDWSILGYYDANRPDQPIPWVAWKGKEVTPFPFVAFSERAIPATPNYYPKRRQFVEAVKAAGLTLFDSRGDMVGQPVWKIREHTEQLAAIYDQVGWDVLAIAEGANENFQNGSFTPDELRAIVEPFKRHGALTIHSTAEQAEEPDAIAAISAGASIYTVHGARGPTNTAILEHIFSLGYFEPRTTPFGPVPRLGIQGEPSGPGGGVSVGRVNDREMLAMMAATSLLSRQWWVYMSGFGVFWEGLIESQPGFYVVPRVRRAIADFAPDVMSWRLFHGGRPEAALKSPTGYDGDPGNINGPARIFNAVSPDRRKVVAVVEGGKGNKRVQNFLDCVLAVTVIGVQEDETLSRHELTLQPRESFIVDYRVGRLLLGQCQ